MARIWTNQLLNIEEILLETKVFCASHKHEFLSLFRRAKISWSLLTKQTQEYWDSGHAWCFTEYVEMSDDVLAKNFAPSSLKNIFKGWQSPCTENHRPVQLLRPIWPNSPRVSSKKACHKKLPYLPCASDRLCTNADLNCCDTWCHYPTKPNL